MRNCVALSRTSEAVRQIAASATNVSSFERLPTTQCYCQQLRHSATSHHTHHDKREFASRRTWLQITLSITKPIKVGCQTTGYWQSDHQWS